MPRTILIHTSVTVPDTDGRSTPDIVQALEGAIQVGSDDDTVRSLEVVMAKVIDGAPQADSRNLESPLRSTAARAAAKKRWATDDLEIDIDVTHLDEEGTGVEGCAWVHAWVFVDASEIEAQL